MPKCRSSSCQTDNKQKDILINQLRSNLQRLETLYHEALDENKKTSNEYERKLTIVNDKLSEMSSENVGLKEKNDILYKLSKEYLERNEETVNKRSGTTVANDDQSDIEILRDTGNQNCESWDRRK